MVAPIVPAEHWPWLGILGLVGGMAGALTFVWRVADYLRSYIKLEISVEETKSGNIKIRNIIENPNISAKTLYGVFLIVGPEKESPATVITNLFRGRKDAFDFNNYNKMVSIISGLVRKDSAIISDNFGRSLIPLPYYYRENIGVADESLSYEVILPSADIPPGTYSVRLYLDPKNRYHRVVQAAFDIAPPASEITAISSSKNIL